jgi:hypothetical protein
MPVRKRSARRNANLSDEAEAWLRGEPTRGFFKYKSDDELQMIWDRYGDLDAFMWQPPMYRPVRKTNSAAQ